MSDEIVISHESGAMTRVGVYVSEEDGAVVVEVDTDANFVEETEIRIYVNDGPAWEGRV